VHRDFFDFAPYKCSAYMSTVEFIVDNIYDSFINNNTCKLKF